MTRNWLRWALFLIAAFATGCASRQTFDVTVTNHLADPVTVWMTKERGAPEPGWTPPEMLAVGTTESQQLGGVAIDPGETGHTRISGHIGSDDVAVLRIYRSVDLNVILTIHRGDPDRVDVPLDPGKTDIDVVQINGQMTYRDHGTTRPSE